ncbi:hypothetical protein [Actinacidiphila sp. ITFR-21]|uniref:hypothetical protein n=1 Tax=Actinacidiphila sp. ITFR-21 TaxID=3075199 RepID=UPI00288A0155|nr:hypothetical protein [Streptomyces sp. ITFR-21]WNI17580.1 hypothetical protein RLT57_20030 [Streptomyces sp. ITFR-21]WNI17720.1 hypothetical protein RLT57_20745 [Streptomyces sp. ITFR-21]
MGLANFNGQQFHTAQHALPGMSTRSMASQRVTPPPPPSDPAPAASSSPTWTQPEISMLGPTPSGPASPSAAGPAPTHWPAPAAAPSAAPAPDRPAVTINRSAYQAAGQRFGPAPDPNRSSTYSRPAPLAPAPAQPGPVPASTPPVRPQAPAWVGRAGRMGGLAVGLGARAVTSVNRAATDPARSGNPLFKTSRGWNKA